MSEQLVTPFFNVNLETIGFYIGSLDSDIWKSRFGQFLDKSLINFRNFVANDHLLQCLSRVLKQSCLKFDEAKLFLVTKAIWLIVEELLS